MTFQAQIPGGAYISVTATRDAQVPGHHYVNQIVASAGTWKTTNGLALASIKRVNGLAKASIKTADGLTP